MSLSETPQSKPSLGPPTKRPRLNGYTSSPSLTKPFKSPFLAQRSGATPATPKQITTPIAPPSLLSEGTAESSPVPRTQCASTIRRQFSNTSFTNTANDPNTTDPENEATIRSHRSQHVKQLTELNVLKQDIDTLEQATRLAGSTRDVELVELIDKWRAVAQQAAEEVFSSCRDRVNKMGGVGVWREREMENRERQREWEADARLYEEKKRRDRERREEEESLASGSGDDEATLRRKRAKRDGVWEGVRDRDDTGGGLGCEIGELEVEEAEDSRNEDLKGDIGDSFTMDMMLGQLGIDLDLVGYSKSRQAWTG